MAEFRADSLTEKPKLEWQKTPHGYVAFATLGKIGHKLTYGEGTQTRQEYLASFTEDSINSIRGMPICLDHPSSGTYQGNKSGAGIGHFLQEILIVDAADGAELLAPVTVTDERGVKLIDQCLEKGHSPEISPAYWVDDVRADGNGAYQQIRGEYDHAALLLPGQGRGGGSISLRLDSSGNTTQTLENKGDPTVTGTTPPTTPTTPAPSAIEQENAALKSQIQTLTGQVEGYKAQIEGLGKTHVTLDSVSERVQTLAKMGRLTADSAAIAVDLTTPTEQLQRDYIKAQKPDLSLEGKSPEYVKGVFDSLTPSPTIATAPADTTTTTTAESVAADVLSPPPLTQDSATAIAAAKGHLSNTRSDSTATNDPIAAAKAKQLERINQNGQKPAGK